MIPLGQLTRADARHAGGNVRHSAVRCADKGRAVFSKCHGSLVRSRVAGTQYVCLDSQRVSLHCVGSWIGGRTDSGPETGCEREIDTPAAISARGSKITRGVVKVQRPGSMSCGSRECSLKRLRVRIAFGSCIEEAGRKLRSRIRRPGGKGIGRSAVG